MTVYFVSRHPGAVVWAARKGLTIDSHVFHLSPCQVGSGDVVIGSLPAHLAAEVCARGARYLHLALDLPVDARGTELSADNMSAFGARLEEFRVERVA